MPIAEGKVFQFDHEDSIRSDFLEVFAYGGLKQHITYETNEFSCVCPFSGLPDFGSLSIVYIPDQYCIELKSLKYYLISFRQVGIYQERVTSRIFEDLFHIVKADYMKVTSVYNTRGGINATCYVERSKGD